MTALLLPEESAGEIRRLLTESRGLIRCRRGHEAINDIMQAMDIILNLKKAGS